MKFIKSLFSKWLPLVVILLLAMLLLIHKIDKPFWGHHDFNNSFYGIMGRNLDRYGPILTKLGQVKNSGFTNHFLYHTHHPPLLIWTLAVSYRLFDVSELSTRAVPLFFSLLTLVFFYCLVKFAYNTKTAFMGSFFWIITPIFIYFGKMAVHEVLVLCFAMFSFWRYLIYLKSRSQRDAIMLYLGIISACLSGWPGFYVPLVILLNNLLKARKITREIILLVTLPVVIFTLHLFHTFLLTGSFVGGSFLESFTLRSSSVALASYIDRVVPWILAYFSKAIVLLAMICLVISVIRTKFDSLIFSFLLFGVMHLLLFREASFRHDYLIYYLLPFFTLAASRALISLSGRSRLMLLTLFTLTVGLSLKQTVRFTDALVQGDRFRESVRIGEYIKNNTRFDQKTLVTLPESSESDYENWHISFYSDRPLKIIRSNVNFPKINLNYE